MSDPKPGGFDWTPEDGTERVSHPLGVFWGWFFEFVLLSGLLLLFLFLVLLQEVWG